LVADERERRLRINRNSGHTRQRLDLTACDVLHNVARRHSSTGYKAADWYEKTQKFQRAVRAISG
jgi:ABC-type lipoprotein release transport system permease subunit